MLTTEGALHAHRVMRWETEGGDALLFGNGHRPAMAQMSVSACVRVEGDGWLGDTCCAIAHLNDYTTHGTSVVISLSPPRRRRWVCLIPAEGPGPVCRRRSDSDSPLPSGRLGR